MSSTSNVTIETATLEELGFVLDLAKKFSNEIGFLPRAAMSWYVENGCVQLARENGEPAAYMLGRGKMRWNPRARPITQAAVCYDAQRRHIGAALVAQVASQGVADEQDFLQLWCVTDIAATSFWPAVGFTAIAARTPKNARDRELTLWRKPLKPISAEELHRLPPVAGWKAAKIIEPTTRIRKMLRADLP